MSHHAIRAAEYRVKADELTVAAAATNLVQVRDKLEKAARRWGELADEEDLRIAQAARNLQATEDRAALQAARDAA